MITDSFDTQSRPLITPTDIYEYCGTTLETLIVVYSGKLIDILLEKELVELIDTPHRPGSTHEKISVYRLKDTGIGVYCSPIGSAIAATIMMEMNAVTRATKFVAYGSCGALVKLEEGKVIVPDYAYRDEGMSYHYAPAKDYIQVRNAGAVARILGEAGVPYVKGKTWSTDAFYMETVNQKIQRIKEGCIVVEMECAGLQAVCDYYGWELYQFLYTADSLEGEAWLQRTLGDLELSDRVKSFSLAVEIAKNI